MSELTPNRALVRERMALRLQKEEAFKKRVAQAKLAYRERFPTKRKPAVPAKKPEPETQARVRRRQDPLSKMSIRARQERGEWMFLTPIPEGGVIKPTPETFDIQEDIREEYMVLNWMNLMARSLPINDD